MSKLHPDLHRNKTEEEQDALHDQASQVTLAYRTLNNPQHRALHLLELMGKPLDETATVSIMKLVLVVRVACSSVTTLTQSVRSITKHNNRHRY